METCQKRKDVMIMDSPEKKLLEISKKILKKDDINIYTPKDEIETWDSLSSVMLIAEIEDNFGISIPFEEIVNINRLADFSKYLEVKE